MPPSSSISVRHAPLILQVYGTSALFEELKEHQIMCYDTQWYGRPSAIGLLLVYTWLPLNETDWGFHPNW